MYCLPCLPGKVAESSEMTGCTECVAGQFASEVNQTSCSVCPRGRFSDEQGSLTCDICTHGTYQEEFGQTSCKECIAGKFNAKGDLHSKHHVAVHNCTSCPSGWSQGIDGSAKCHQCDPGFYTKNVGSTTCTSCKCHVIIYLTFTNSLTN